MVVGYKFAYEIGWLSAGTWLLMLAVPILLFIGYYLAKILFRDFREALPKEEPEASEKIIVPHDLDWSKYTLDEDARQEIIRAIHQLSDAYNLNQDTYHYKQVHPFLRTQDANLVAHKIQLFLCVTEEELQAHKRMQSQSKHA